VTYVREATSPALIRTPVVPDVPQAPTGVIQPGWLPAVVQARLLDSDTAIMNILA
jgi:hypothetical protein